MSKLQRARWLLLLILLASLVTSCTRAPSSPTIHSESGALHPKSQELSQYVATAVEPSASKNKTFGIIYPMTYPTYEMITMDAAQSAEKHHVTLTVNAPDEASTEQQIRILDNMIKQQVDGIAIAPIDIAALTPVIHKAAAAGIPVITFESDAPSSERVAYVGADNYQTGRQFAQTTARLLNNEGMILVESGMEEMVGLQQRLDGFIDYIRNDTDIEILEIRYNQGNEDRAVNDIESMIDAHPHFNAVVGLDFVSVSASALVWKAKGLNRHLIAFGGNSISEEGLLNGQISAVISQNEQVWGTKMIETLLRASEGLPVENFINTGIKEINQTEVTSE